MEGREASHCPQKKKNSTQIRSKQKNKRVTGGKIRGEPKKEYDKEKTAQATKTRKTKELNLENSRGLQGRANAVKPGGKKLMART